MKSVFRTQTHMTTNARPRELQTNQRKEDDMNKEFETIPAPPPVILIPNEAEKDIDDWYEKHGKLETQSENLDIDFCRECAALLRIHTSMDSSELCNRCEQKLNAELELGTEVNDDIPPPPPVLLLAERS